MNDKRSTQAGSNIDPELKSQAEKQLLEEIALIEHWINNIERQSPHDAAATQLHAKYLDMLRSRQDMLAALQKQQS